MIRIKSAPLVTCLVLFAGLLLLPGISRCQQRQLDSLLGELNGHRKDDMARLKLLNGIAYLYTNILPLKSITTAEEAITLARSIGDKKELVRAYNNKARSLISIGKSKDAVEPTRKALQLSLAINDKASLAETYLQMASVAANDHDSCMRLLHRSQQLYTELGSK